MRIKPLAAIFFTGVVCLVIHIGLFTGFRIRTSIHESEVVNHAAVVEKMDMEYHFNLASRYASDNEYIMVYARFEDGRQMYLTTEDGYSSDYGTGSNITVYEWNGKYALSIREVFMPKFLIKIGDFLAIAAMILIVLPIVLKYKNFDD